ncbi:hypothetical protein [Candidatus Wolbachia massiliensis]|uniref:Uncharacterized protein n=1 Tax=Candidatus Wolbachia massiliensis TaxID=1845000 RepID=A0A7L7YLL4_9RICK|nr:hypothetical protein [Candidatus Wolbachia massiliensis]QOD38150.1 hypothetical protein ID128_05075 [Candidatus Wolbachia massiliensis]
MNFSAIPFLSFILPTSLRTFVLSSSVSSLDLLQNSVKDGKVRKRGMRSEGK